MKTIEEREREFRKHVYDLGGTTYTKTMIDRFIDHWAEPDRAPSIRQKMRFEKQKTWRTTSRLATWARNNYDKIQCHLTESQKTIAQKKKAFAESLEPFLAIYGSELLNKFFSYWAAAENKPTPEFLRFERESFWETSTRLAQWKTRNEDVMVKQKVG